MIYLQKTLSTMQMKKSTMKKFTDFILNMPKDTLFHRKTVLTKKEPINVDGQLQGIIVRSCVLVDDMLR